MEIQVGLFLLKHAKEHTQLGDFKSLMFMFEKDSNVKRHAEFLLIIFV